MIEVENVVIGGGPAGYVAGIRLGQLKREVLLIEKKRLGGVCLNEGCIPTKALLSATELIHSAEKFKRAGVIFQPPEIQTDKLDSWKNSVVDRLVKGVEFLFNHNNVGYVKAEARFLDQNTLLLDSGEQVKFRNAIIATGSHPVEIPNFEFNDIVISSSQALQVNEIPERMLIIGGGVIGLEIATIYARLGTKVTVVELMEQILPGIDIDLVKVVEKNLKALGIEIHTSSKAISYEGSGPVKVKALIKGEERIFEVDKILLSVGRKPNSAGLGLEKIGVAIDSRGFIKTSKDMRTNIPHIFGVGDVSRMPMLAHKAHREGIVAAENATGENTLFENKVIPAVVYTSPEIATLGISEREAREQGINIEIGRFPLAANGRAIGMMEYDGFVKIIVEKDSDVVLGAGIVAPHAGELIGELALAMELEATSFDIGFTIHPHPTISEAIMEAAEFIHRKAIHIVNRKG